MKNAIYKIKVSIGLLPYKTERSQDGLVSKHYHFRKTKYSICLNNKRCNECLCNL